MKDWFGEKKDIVNTDILYMNSYFTNVTDIGAYKQCYIHVWFIQGLVYTTGNVQYLLVT